MEKFVTGNLSVCVCAFLKQKIYVLNFDLCGRVGDKKIFTWPISGNVTTFLLA